MAPNGTTAVIPEVFLTIKTHRLLRFIDSNVQPPPERIVKDSQSIINPDFEAFEEQDGALSSWLLSTVSENVLPYLIGLNSAFEIWNTLHRVFSGKTTSRLMYFRRLLHSQKKGDLSMNEFLMKVKSVSDNLANCGEVISEHEHVTTILNGLRTEYESTMAVLTSGTTLSTVTNVHTVLLDAEARQTTFLTSLPAYAHVTSLQPSVSNYAHITPAQSGNGSALNSSQPSNS
ncbi:hypothetical protein GQ457_14G027020 [Hibiscus cannabinus]